MGIVSSVGRRHGRNSQNRVSDQRTVQELLNKIPARLGGAEGALNERMIEGICSDKLYLAILTFQKKTLPQVADGHVDPGSRTFTEMERLANMHDLVVGAAKAVSDAMAEADRRQAVIDHAVDQMEGNVPGSNPWDVDGSDAPLSGIVPYMAGPGVASVARIPIPGTNGLALELSPRGWVPPTGSTSTIFIQDVTGKKHLRLDYGYNTKSKTIDYHWNRGGAAKNVWGIQDHTTVGRGGKILYRAGKYLRWGGRVLLVVGVALDIWSIVQSSKPLRRTTQVVFGWAGAWAGCEGGGAVVGGIGTFIEPGGGTAVGGFVGCIGGGIGGYLFGSKVGGVVYDWAEDTFFTPLPAADQP
ncbi:membrane hypothetical protein [Bradyrhizobium sp. STM 3843]|uniref:hypothetical protein n=1 Tax=Bradyrhizobium sp. STM 3843 TaxID=551947 RepID=UPI0002407760|nr:hypothetical protein [Bradyrhizobium sp. STM 3843]CCE07296.1 membrane hypothetical protein [Bradyrhizobium sp. STM 3843]